MKAATKMIMQMLLGFLIGFTIGQSMINAVVHQFQRGNAYECWSRGEVAAVDYLGHVQCVRKAVQL